MSKKVYEAPQLSAFGDFQELTLSAEGNFDDAAPQGKQSTNGFGTDVPPPVVESK